MRNIKLNLEYDGTNYCGWQVQRRKGSNPSIQGVLEKTLHKILQEKVKIIGSGRTDSGVHALAQVAQFKTDSNLSSEKLKRALNALLPDDIVVHSAKEVAIDFNSCFDARSKVYRYVILNDNCPSALARDRVYFCPYPLDIKLMRQEARFLLGRHDVKSFCTSGSNVKYTTRTIKRISIKKIHYNLLSTKRKFIIIDIEADGFLYNMVRSIVGTLVDIGRGRFKKESLKRILLAQDRRFAGTKVPARGLYLVKVNY